MAAAPDPNASGQETDAEVAPPRPIHVTDVGDPRLGDYAALTDAALRKRYEHQHGVLIAEGPNPVRALVTSPYPVRSFLVAEERVEAMAPVLASVRAPAYVVTRALLEELVRFRLHQGVLACGARLPAMTPAQVVAGSRRVLVLEGLNDHENLGTLFRTARAFRVGGVLLAPGCADPLYRRSVRVSMGHVLHVPFARVETTSGALDLLHEAGFTTLALTPDPAAPPIDRLVLAGDRTALLLGAEGPGLSAGALTATTTTARITMAAGVDSLNVAAAGAIACHELARRG